MRNEKLIEARLQRGWTQAEASEKLQMSRVAYARWEEQGVVPRQWGMLKAREVFKMTPEQLGFRSYATSNNEIPFATPSVPIMSSTNAPENMLRFAVSALTLAGQSYGCSLHELLIMTEQEMRRLDAMTQQQSGKQVSRREALKFLVGLPAVFLGLSALDEQNTVLADTDILPAYVTAVPACWKLYFDGGLSEVATVLPHFLSHLTAQLQRTTLYHSTVASLLAQTHQLGYLLALQDQNFKTAQTHAQMAFQYAQMAHDPNLQVTSLIRLGNLFYTLKRPTQTLETYQEAVQQSEKVSPLLRGQALIGLAETYAQFYGKTSTDTAKQMALRSQAMAHEIFPATPEDDPHYAYTHFNHFTLANFEGLMYIHLGQPSHALEVFDQVDRSVPHTIVPQRVELLNRRASALLALGDMHETGKHLEQVVPSAIHLGTELRYHEACEIYQQMQEQWPNEQYVKDLAELFHSSIFKKAE